MAQPSRAPKEVHITFNVLTVLKVVGVLAAVFLLYVLRDLVALILIALLIAVAIDPIVDMFARRMPRTVSAALVFLAGLVVVVGVLVLVIPTVITEARVLLSDYSWLIEDITGGAIPLRAWFEQGYIAQDAGELARTIQESSLAEALPAIASFLSTLFGGFISVIVVLALAFFMVIEEKGLRSGIIALLPKRHQELFTHLMPIVREKIGKWLRGQLTLMTIMFSATYIILLILDVPFALLLALLAGVLDLVPFIGAILAFFPIVLVALSSSGIQAVLVAIAFIVNQQIHGDIITPKIMQSAAGINPVVTIIAILVGFQIAGVAGAILAIPSAMLIGVFAKEWTSHKTR